MSFESICAKNWKFPKSSFPHDTANFGLIGLSPFGKM